VAVTGAHGALGQALLRRWHRRGALLIALTHRPDSGAMAPLRLLEPDGAEIPLRQVGWRCGQEEELAPLLDEVDVLVLNHGVNPYARRDGAAVSLALEVNALSHWRLLEHFAAAVARRPPAAPPPAAPPADAHSGEGAAAASQTGAPTGRRRLPEVWINTSEAEIQPALSPLYEISKRLLGQLLSLRALDLAAPGPQGRPTLRLRRLVLGPFRSDLNPYGVMAADWVAGEILRQADWNLGLIIVTINPLTYVLMPLAALSRWAYFRCFTRRNAP
jgi:NAD(P)-dependent dehydrogenase (short-subunit alcohol dehydrogenase family)